ncbi:MAG: phosphoenolpyruvate carboxykinase (ATP) [Pseudomonadota bacterium]|nr:phosphoenolpyruvate carboxykinase (ATP) [Pseudomonadota bacterium]
MTTAWLIEESLKKNLGTLSRDGALIVKTGQFTGRAAKNRFVVNKPALKNLIDWGLINVPLDEKVSQQVFETGVSFLKKTSTYSMRGFVGGFPIEVMSTSPWHIAFAKNMFREKTIAAIAEKAPPGKVIRIYHIPFSTSHSLGLTNVEETIILLDPTELKVVIMGTAYAGEIKKSAFSLCNFIFPQMGYFPMHASANCLKDGSESSVLFGLSGTGKTTLSASPDRYLIGDDEIVWTPSGLSNMEGGCYAKLIGLSLAKEPEIFRASNRFGSILENVVFDEDTKTVDFDDQSITENTRSSYSLDALEKTANQFHEASAPKNLIFLTADAFGALPAVAKLNSYQAQYHFLSGYTAKLAGTEIGVKEPVAVFSTCFGAPFMPLNPANYASLLAKYMESSKAQVWLLNTGWTGKGYGHGDRFPLAVTREILRNIQSGHLTKAPMSQHATFGFEVPTSISGVDGKFLQSQDPEQVSMLAEKFIDNMSKFSNLESGVIEKGGPRPPKHHGTNSKKSGPGHFL